MRYFVSQQNVSHSFRRSGTGSGDGLVVVDAEGLDCDLLHDLILAGDGRPVAGGGARDAMTAEGGVLAVEDHDEVCPRCPFAIESTPVVWRNLMP